MALFEDLADILNLARGAVQTARSAPTSEATVSDTGGGLRGLLGPNTLQSENRAMNFIEGLPPIAKSILQNEAMGMGYSNIEEAMRFAPALMQSRATELAKYYLTPAGEPTRYQPPMGPISIKPLPPLPPKSEDEILAADIAGGGMLMAAPEEDAMSRIREQYRRNVGSLEEMNPEMQTRVYGGVTEFGNRLPGAMQLQAEKEGAYGKKAIDAASGIETGLSGREIGQSFGRSAASEQEEREAALLGLSVMPIGSLLRFATLARVPAQIIEAAATSPAARKVVEQAIIKNVKPGGQTWESLLRQAGQRTVPPRATPQSVPSGGGRLQEALYAAGQGKPVQSQLYRDSGVYYGMARGGNVRDAIMNRYNRMV